MKRLRKVVSLLLACSMIAGSTVTTALAASPTDEISEREIRNAELSRSVAAQGMVCLLYTSYKEDAIPLFIIRARHCHANDRDFCVRIFL